MNWSSLVIPTLILLFAMITDIKERKIYNKWIVASILLALLSNYVFYDFAGIKSGAAGAGLGLVLSLPLVLAGVLGAGDMKLLFAFGLATTYDIVFTVAFFSIISGAIIGIGYSIYKGQFQQLFRNTAGLLMAKSPDEKTLNKIPFSVAIFVGWVAYILVTISKGGL